MGLPVGDSESNSSVDDTDDTNSDSDGSDSGRDEDAPGVNDVLSELPQTVTDGAEQPTVELPMEDTDMEKEEDLSFHVTTIIV